MLSQYNLNITSTLIYCRKDEYADFRQLLQYNVKKILINNICILIILLSPKYTIITFIIN